MFRETKKIFFQDGKSHQPKNYQNHSRDDAKFYGENRLALVFTNAEIFLQKKLQTKRHIS